MVVIVGPARVCAVGPRGVVRNAMAMGPEGQQGELCSWKGSSAQQQHAQEHQAAPGKKGGGGGVRV